GYLVGNPVADEIFDGNALVPFAHGMGLISDETFEDTTKECNGTFYETSSVKCENLLNKIEQVIQLYTISLRHENP
ncbi:serine carboxypeptidase 20-like protein, partial [Trifolium pratense]